MFHKDMVLGDRHGYFKKKGNKRFESSTNKKGLAFG